MVVPFALTRLASVALEVAAVDLEVAVVVEDTEVAVVVVDMVAVDMAVVIVNKEAMGEVKAAMVVAVVDMAAVAADTPVVGDMVEESSKARAVVADGSKCWGRDLLSDLARVRTF